MLPLFLTVLSPYTALLTVIFMTLRVFQRNYPINRNPWNTGMLLLFAWSLLVGILNKNVFSSAASLVILFYFFAGIYIQNNFYEQKLIEKLLHNVIIITLISSAIGIAEKISAEYFHTLKWGYILGMPVNITMWKDYRIYSTFGNPNVAGDWFAIMALIGIYFFSVSSGRKRLLYASSVYVFIFMLNLTGSRGAGISLLSGLFLFTLFIDKKKSLWFIVSVFCTVTILMFILPQLIPIFNKVNTSMNHGFTRSFVSRQSIWQSCFNMFKAKPVTGFGILGIYFSESNTFMLAKEPHAHNLWLTFAATLGIVGLLIYLYMKIYIYEGLIKLIKHRCGLATLLFSIQAVIVIHGLVDFTIMAPQMGIVFIISSSMICALYRQYSPNTADNGYLLLPMNKRELQLK